MNRQLIINVTSNEITIALVENGKLVELNSEKGKTGFAVGDIFYGRVRKIMPGLNAAFVNIGYEKDAFIHYLDLGFQFPSLHKLTNLLSSKKNIRFDKFRLEESIEKVGKMSTQVAGAQPIIVQIAKEAISTKGPRLTSDISLAGRHVVLIPFSNKVSISQKIRSNEEKKRLKKIAQKILPNNYGVIIRTAAMGKDTEDLEQDIKSQIERWESALERVKNEEPPTLLLGEMNRATTIIRDLLNGSFSSIVVDDQTTYKEIHDYIKVIAPEKQLIVKYYKGKVPIFDNYDISKQIKSLFAKIISLKKGAYLIVEHTEAMHVIDVNSGNRARVDSDQESTAMDVNLMAAEEIAHQLRLRDMGGIIVVDFIDLHKAENRKLLAEKMREFMANDRAKHTILPISKFGLMQITRQRVRQEVEKGVDEVCPVCHGTGDVSPTVLIDQQIEDQIEYFAKDRKLKSFEIQATPVIAGYLTKGFFSVRKKWQRKYGVKIKVTPDQSLSIIEVVFRDNKGRKLV